MNIYTIIAKRDYGVSGLIPTTVTLTGIQGTFANEVYDSVESAFWKKLQGCSGCEFENTEEWEMPCCKCKRISKDYYRCAEDGGEEQKE